MESVFYGIETLNKKDMTNEEKLSKALRDFKTKYPSITSADLQTFIIGWQEAVKNCFIPDVRFLLPSDEQLINTAILFNDGKLEPEKLSDMVGMCQFVIDRLYENGDIMKQSSKEGN